MNYQHVQSPTAGVMIRPHRFMSNPETAADNAFQFVPTDLEPEVIAARARDEFDRAVEKLTAEGVKIHVFDDFGDHETPDLVFPNNWFSTHHGGRVALFPMYSPSRRRERRQDVIEMLKSDYRVQEVVDYSGRNMTSFFSKAPAQWSSITSNGWLMWAGPIAQTRLFWRDFAPRSVMSRWLLIHPTIMARPSITPM